MAGEPTNDRKEESLKVAVLAGRPVDDLRSRPAGDRPAQRRASGHDDRFGGKPRARRSFTREFKAEIVELGRRGDRSAGQVAKDFDLTETAVRAWIAQAERDAGTSTDVGRAAMSGPSSAGRGGRTVPCTGKATAAWSSLWLP
jgi:transposase-like protein